MSSPLFLTFPTSISNFPPSFLQFSLFSSQFSPFSLFFLASFFQYVSKNFPVRSLWGHSAPPVCYTTALWWNGECLELCWNICTELWAISSSGEELISHKCLCYCVVNTPQPKSGLFTPATILIR